MILLAGGKEMMSSAMPPFWPQTTQKTRNGDGALPRKSRVGSGDFLDGAVIFPALSVTLLSSFPEEWRWSGEVLGTPLSESLASFSASRHVELFGGW